MPSVPAPHAAIDVAAADGTVLRVRRHGRLSGKRLVCSHGNGFAIDGYIHFWSHFLAGFEVVVFDMRSHGQNPRGVPENHDYPHMVGDIDAICRAISAEWGNKPTIGVFHSMSAQSALLQTMRSTCHFDALVLFDPPNVPPEGDPARQPMLAYLRKLTGWAATRRDRFADPEELAAEYAATRAGRRWHRGAAQAIAEAVLCHHPDGMWQLACPRNYESSMYAQGMSLDLWPHRTDVPVPVKLIGGDPGRDYPDPTALSNRALAAAGGFDYSAIPGTGHLLQLEQPAACADAVIEFLRGEKGFCGDAMC